MPTHDWSERYQPVSYSVARSRSGTGAEFTDMVTRCKAAGVDIIADAVINHMTNYTVVDAYAGTGAVGIEALSRGAAHAFFLERNRLALEAIRDNLASLGLESRATVLTGPALLTIARQRASIVFVDPPYSLELEYRNVLDLLSENPPPLTIVQHSVHFALADAYGPLHRTRMVKQSDNALSFYVSDPLP